MNRNAITLSNGLNLPAICYGTDIVSDRLFDDNPVRELYKKTRYLLSSIKHHNMSKYRRDKGIIRCLNLAVNKNVIFFDTSRAYSGSEKMISKALKGIPRDQYIVCTKLCNYDQLHNKLARDALKTSMEQLGVDYVDIYLLHWPVAEKFLNYWKQLEELYDEGIVKAIGVSNCKIHHLEEIEKIAKIRPMVDEVELHPLLSEVELRNYCQDKGIQIMAYSSTGRGDFRLLRSSRLKSICDNHHKSTAQVILRWHIQNGVLPIFNTSSPEHLRENLNVFDFELTDDEMSIIESLNINSRKRYDSDNCEFENL